MPQIISCPKCAMQLRVPDTFTPGSMVKCPKCSETFPVPGPGGPAAPNQISAVPPPPSMPAWQGDQPRDPFGRPGGIEGVAGAYRIDFGEIWGTGMAQYSVVLGPMVGYGYILVAIMFLGFIPYIGACFSFLTGLFVQFAMLAGFVVGCLMQLQGRPVTFNDLFGGFQYWVPLFLLQLISTAISIVFMVPFLAVIFIWAIQTITQAQANQGSGAPPPTPDMTLIVVAVLLYLLAIIPLIYISIRCFLFSTWFVIDQNLGPVEAIKANWEFTRGHFWGWFGVTFVLGLIVIVGVFLPCCYLGLPFTLPVMYLVLTAGYLRYAKPGAMDGGAGPI